MLNEELLTVWLRLTSIIDNQRLVSGLPFNEAVVCNLLAKAQQEDLCAHTRILKSQMNAILVSLERKGVIARQRSRQDRRQVELRLLPEGLDSYRAAHGRVLSMVDRLIDEMGEDSVRTLLPLLRQAADIFDNMEV